MNESTANKITGALADHVNRQCGRAGPLALLSSGVESKPREITALKESGGLALALVLMAFTAIAAALPPNLARSAKATATSEFSGQNLPGHKPMNRL